MVREIESEMRRRKKHRQISFFLSISEILLLRFNAPSIFRISFALLVVVDVFFLFSFAQFLLCFIFMFWSVIFTLAWYAHVLYVKDDLPNWLEWRGWGGRKRTTNGKCKRVENFYRWEKLFLFSFWFTQTHTYANTLVDAAVGCYRSILIG